MAKKYNLAASRDIAARRLALGLTLCVAGAGGGALLGHIAVGSGLRSADAEGPSFANLSANPDALAVNATSSLVPCPGCSDSYGVAARMRADHERRMAEPFRRLGEVDVDTEPFPDTSGDYRYGGRFPDPPPRQAAKIPQSGETVVPAAAVVTLPDAIAPATAEVDSTAQ